MEQDKKLRDGPGNIWSINYRKHGRISYGKKILCLQQIVLEKLDSDMQKNETGPHSYTIHKKKLKID